MAMENFINKLTDFVPSGAPVLSLYLNAQPNEHGRDNFNVFVKKELTEKSKTFDEGSSELDSFNRDAELISEYLKDVRADANGIAIFACADANFFEALQLDMPIERSRLFIYDQPHIYPLARLVSQYPRYAVLSSDTNSARIFVFGSNGTEKTKEIENVKTNRSQVGGWSQMRYQRHIENYHEQHAKEVIAELEKIVREDGIEQVILAGDEKVIIPLLKEQMPKHLSEKVVDTVRLNVNTPEHEIYSSTLESVQQHTVETEAEKVEQAINAYRADGLGVVGVAPTLEALSNGQVEELLMPAKVSELQYNTKQVEKVLDAYAPGEEDEKAPADPDEPRLIADELIVKAQQSSAKVTFVEDSSLLSKVGGVCALLRYRI